MTLNDTSALIAQAKIKAQGYLDGYFQDVITRLCAYIDNGMQEEGMNYLTDQLIEVKKRRNLAMKTFPGSLVSGSIFEDHQCDNDDFYQWYQAFRIIEADKSFSPVFTFDPKYELDVFEQERREYETNPDFTPKDSSLFFSEVLITVISYQIFRQTQIEYLEKKFREADSGRPGPGLNCPFTEEQKVKLYEGCLGQKLIAPNTDQDNFIKALSPGEYPNEKIRWIDVNRKDRPKSISLACFYYVVVPSSKDEAENYTIDRPAIKRCFADKDGNEFQVKTPKKTDPSFDRWMRKFRAMLEQ